MEMYCRVVDVGFYEHCDWSLSLMNYRYLVLAIITHAKAKVAGHTKNSFILCRLYGSITYNV